MAAGRAKGAPPAQVERFHQELVELIRQYQFRDRNRMTRHGISVSQCYVLECLVRRGPQSMKDLAATMCLTVSTLTRLIDQLEARDLVAREIDSEDGRLRRVRATPRGRALHDRAWSEVFASEEAILESFPASRREAVIEVLARLNDAIPAWQAACRRPARSAASPRPRD